MSESVNLPALGESVTEGTVTRWLKKVGDRVEVDEPLVEVSTDKVDTEIPSPVAGVIEAILVAEDETVAVGTALVTIGDGTADSSASETAQPPEAETQELPGVEQSPAESSTDGSATNEPAPAESPSAESPSAEPVEETASDETPANGPTSGESPVQEAPAEEPAAQEPAGETRNERGAGQSAAVEANAGYVTPLVRKLAHDNGIDLTTVSGTGIGGRIRKQDVLDAGAAGRAAKTAPAQVSPLRGTSVPMSRLRKVIAERAVVSMQTSAQLTSVVEVDVSRVASLRTAVKDRFQSKTGLKLSFLPFFALAAVEALKVNPIINATIDEAMIVYPPQENLSIAVDTERGLLTPVIRDAGRLDIAGLAREIADLAERTRNNQLKPDELAGGTFTLTNTGSRGALFDTPIVFLPQVAILGTGVVAKRPVVVGNGDSDAIAIRSMVYLTLSYDHRIVDGADAARFLVAVKDRLEDGDFEANLGI